MLLHPPRGSSRAARRSLVAAALAATTTFALPALAPAAEPLPGGRVIELVSPPETNNENARPGGVMAENPLIYDDGHMALGQNFNASFPETGNGWGAAWKGIRHAHGWERTSLESPIEEQLGRWRFEVMAGTADLSRTLLMRASMRSVFAEGPTFRFRGPTILEIVDAAGARTTVANVSWPDDEVTQPEVTVSGWSENLRTVVFSSRRAPEGMAPAPPGREQLYVWRDGKLEVAGDAPGGPDPACGGSFFSGLPDESVRTISADGSIAYLWLTEGERGSGACGLLRLYARVGGRVWHIDAPDADAPSGTVSVPQLLGVSPDGLTSYFTTGSALTASDQNTKVDLYRSAMPAGGGRPTLACVTCAFGGSDGVEVDPTGGGQVSRDGSTVYFHAARPIDGQGADRPGNVFEFNLFAYRDGKVRLVSDRAGLMGFGDSAGVNMTRDGRSLLFRSRANVTSVDTGGTEQLYRAALEEDGTSSVSCMSCDPGGAPPSGDVASAGSTRNSFISDDGRTVAFASNDALTPTAVAGLQNLYVWEDGKLGLIHAGLTSQEPTALGVSPEGNDVYFAAFGALTAETQQTTESIYNARRGGGFPTPVLPQAPCSGDGCRGIAAPQPVPTPVATVAFGGADDRPTAAGKVRALKPKVRGRSVRVDVEAPGAGRLSITGERVRSLSRTVTKEGTARMAVELTSDARKILMRRKRVKVALKVTFRPAGGGAAQTARLTVTVKR